MAESEKSYKEYLKNITTFIFDVDGVLTDGTIQVNTNGELLRTMHIKDGYALKVAVEQGFKVCIISGGTNEGVRKRLENLGIKDIYLGISNKIEVLNDYMKTHFLERENILYMGDDLPDYHIMKEVGLACCPQDAVPEIKAISGYISHKNGGKGCVRDVIEQVMKIHGKWTIASGAAAKLD